jgi:BirA family biotin operon repressor/biotin-[acetyl-CoA-carboxylase] ligase
VSLGKIAMSENSELQETAVSAALTSAWVGRPYHYLPRTDSTNDRLKARVAAGDAQTPPAGTVLLTDYQEQGKGRLQRRWEAPPGTALLFSVLFRPDWPAQQAPWLTMIAGLAVVAALETIVSLPVGLKWPNDVMLQVEGVWRKTGGLLVEGEMDENGRLSSAVVGIGLNVNIPAAHLPQAATPPTSLLAATGTPLERLPLLVDVLAHLEERYETAVAGHSPQPAWNERLITLGRPVRVSDTGEGEVIEGAAIATDAWGNLRVRDENGREHTIAAGDVTLRR